MNHIGLSALPSANDDVLNRKKYIKVEVDKCEYKCEFKKETVTSNTVGLGTYDAKGYKP